MAMAGLRTQNEYLPILADLPLAKISNSCDIPPNIGIISHHPALITEFIPMPDLDAIDRKILSLLQTDSRMTMQELADKVGLSVSPCHRRVKLMEQRGVITRYIATVDQKSLGLHVSVFISIKLARQKEEDQPLCQGDLEMGRGAGMLFDDGQPRLPPAGRRRRLVVV
jgi:hypothetical protein